MTTTIQPPPRVPTPPPPERPGGHLAGLILGTLLALIGLVLAAMAVGAGWAAFAQRGERFLTTPTARYTVGSYALTSGTVTGLADDPMPMARRQVAEALLQATAADPTRAVFVGIGPRAQVQAYLNGVETDQLSTVTFRPFRPSYRNTPGTRTPADPSSQTFWAVSAEGTGLQTVRFPVRGGDWMAVVMNGDGSRGVSVDLAAGGRTTLLAPISLGIGLAALLALAGGTALLVWGAAGRRGVPSAVGAVVPGVYPAQLTGQLEPVSRGLWLVKWLLLIPHYLVLAVLIPAAALTTVVAWFAILITARYPRPLFDFSVGVLRWTWRVGFYGYSALGTDRYPPFTLQRTDYPADFVVAYPERLSRGLVLVKSWLLALPHLIVVGLLTAPWYWVANQSPTSSYQDNAGISLLGLLTLVAGLAVLFTGRYPRPLFDLVMGINRWVYRACTYVALLRDEYPPFRLDQGPAEAEAVPAAAPPSPVDAPR